MLAGHLQQQSKIIAYTVTVLQTIAFLLAVTDHSAVLAILPPYMHAGG